MKKLLLLFVLLTLGASAEDIVLTNGIIYQNVKIIREGSETILYSTSEGKQLAVKRAVVKEIIRVEFNPVEKTITSSTESRIEHIYKWPNIQNIIYSFPAAVLAWDYWKRSGDVQDWIDVFKILDVEHKALDKEKTRAVIIASVLTGFTVYNTVISLQRVEVTAQDGMIGMAVHF